MYKPVEIIPSKVQKDFKDQNTLLGNIRHDHLQARRTGDKPKLQLLATLIGDIVKVGKDNGNREATDEEGIKVIQKFIKGLDEILTILTSEEYKQDTRDPKDTEKKVETAKKERAFLEAYLPSQLSDAELETAIRNIIVENDYSSKRDVGKVMKELAAHHSGEYDGKYASTIVKGYLV